eukprot:c5187_g1_i2.p1 GENE.c5187_g1_i2~~c5187_g1_i2.p1  ORF type:complete len:263 (+),score=31.56 c5187_g1_i2:110-790(+)
MFMGDPEELRVRFAGPDGRGGGKFEDVESREIAKHMNELIEVCKPLEGKVVADIGAGTGLLLQKLHEAVGEQGAVVALDISDGFLALLNERIVSENLSDRVRSQLCFADGLGMEPESIDVALLIDVYHHLEKPRAFVQDIAQCLRPGGRLIMVDIYRLPERQWSHPPEWVLAHVRAGQDEFRAEILSTECFVLHSEPLIEGFRENYIMIFEKAPGAVAESISQPCS